MTLSIRQFPCLVDNYGFLVRDAATGAVAVTSRAPRAAASVAVRRAWEGDGFIVVSSALL